MGMNVARFSLCEIEKKWSSDKYMGQCDDGDWVDYDDYAQLEQQVKELKQVCRELHSATFRLKDGIGSLLCLPYEKGDELYKRCEQLEKETRVESLASIQAEAIAEKIHYPRCWDTMAYPTLDDALSEFDFKCGPCSTEAKP